MSYQAILMLLTLLGDPATGATAPLAESVWRVHLSDAAIDVVASSKDGKHLAVSGGSSAWLLDWRNKQSTRLETQGEVPVGFAFSADGHWLVAASGAVTPKAKKHQFVTWDRMNDFSVKSFDTQGLAVPFVSFVGPQDHLLVTMAHLEVKRRVGTGHRLLLLQSSLLGRPDALQNFRFDSSTVQNPPSRFMDRFSGPADGVNTSANPIFCIANAKRLQFVNCESLDLEYSLPFNYHLTPSRRVLLALAKDGTWVVVQSKDGLIYVWDILLHKKVAALRPNDHRSKQLVSSPSGTITANLNENGIIDVWDWNTLSSGSFTLKDSHPSCIALVDENSIAVGTKSGDVNVFALDRQFISRRTFISCQRAARERTGSWCVLENSYAAMNVAKQLQRFVWQEIDDQGSSVFTLYRPRIVGERSRPSVDLPSSSEVSGLDSVLQLAIVNCTKQFLEFVADMPKLRVLEFSRTDFRADDLKCLRDHKRLEVLWFGHSYFDDDCWESLSDLKRLKWIGVRSDKITGKGIGHLKKNSNLTFLGISGQHLDISTLQELASASHLEHLYFPTKDLSDEEMSSLRMWFPKTTISDRSARFDRNSFGRPRMVPR